MIFRVFKIIACWKCIILLLWFSIERSPGKVKFSRFLIKIYLFT